MRKSPTATAAVALTMAATGVTLSGCTRLCSETTLSTTPVRVVNERDPLVLRAELTRDGEPFPGQRVNFFSSSSNSDGDYAGQTLGKETTDENGVATLTVRGGTDGITLPSENLTGYRAKFTPIADIDGTRYCASRSESAIR